MAEGNWLANVINWEVKNHFDDAKNKITKLKKDNPTADPDILVNSLIDDKAWMSAFVGMGTGALSAVPGIGTALGMGVIIPEALYLAKVQIDITLCISMIYENDLTMDDAKGIVITCLTLALGADFIKKELIASATGITKSLVQKTITKMGEKQLMKFLEKMSINATKEGILKKIPIISVPLNATLNYGQIKTFGWVVKKFMSPTFIMCGKCGQQTGKLNKFCPGCGATF